MLAWALSNCFRFVSIFLEKITLLSFYVIALLNLIVYLISEPKLVIDVGKNNVDEVEAICDLIFECLKLLFSNLDPYFIQRRIYQRNLSSRFVSIDLMNMLKVFLLL